MSEIKRPDKSILEAMKEACETLDTKTLDPDSNGFESLPDGYFLTELVKADFKMSKGETPQPQIVITLKTVENGYSLDLDIHGKTKIKEIKGTAKKNAWCRYNITPDKIRRFANDMVKFEDENHDRYLEEDAFKDPELLYDAMQVLVELKPRIYIKQDVDTDNNTSFTNLVSWKKAKDLGLPLE